MIPKKVVFSLMTAAALTAMAVAQPPGASSVSEILAGHDRALIRDLSDYLRKHPKADDRDQAFAALFNKAIEHDWFAQTEDMAQRYLADEPDGPVKALRRSSSPWDGHRPASTRPRWSGTRS